MEKIIEESIWCIEQKLPIRKCIFKYDGNQITRNLFILGDSEYKNNKIDIIDSLQVSIKEINEMTVSDLGSLLKDKLAKCFELNVSNEIPFFTSPIIYEK